MINCESRRTALRIILSAVLAGALIPGCSTEKSRSRAATNRVLGLLRHEGVAAHLGRLEIEAKPELQSLTADQLAADILQAIDLDYHAISDSQIDLIRERLSTKVREDFANESITTVDGWLLSVTEAKACALVYLSIAQASE